MTAHTVQQQGAVPVLVTVVCVVGSTATERVPILDFNQEERPDHRSTVALLIDPLV